MLVAKHACVYYPDCVKLQTVYAIKGEVKNFIPSWASGLTNKGGAMLRDNIIQSTTDKVIYEVLHNLAYAMTIRDRAYIFTALANLFIFA